jgi:catechol 1,2-dioxygenase
MIDVPGYRKLVTHLFNHDDPYLASDAVFGVKQSLQVIYEERVVHDDLSARLGIEVPFKRACYEFVMETE